MFLEGLNRSYNLTISYIFRGSVDCASTLSVFSDFFANACACFGTVERMLCECDMRAIAFVMQSYLFPSAVDHQRWAGIASLDTGTANNGCPHDNDDDRWDHTTPD